MTKSRRRSNQGGAPARTRRQQSAATTFNPHEGGLPAERDEVVLNVRLFVKRSELAALLLSHATLLGTDLAGIQPEGGPQVNTVNC